MLLRIFVLFQNRSLIIDEANVVRNIAELNFLELTQALKYEQFAPIIFLWIQKVISIFFGFDEVPMRIFSFLNGVGSIFLFIKIAYKLKLEKYIWLPLGIFCFSLVYIEYATCVKQYMSDVLCSFLLIYASQCISISKESNKKFIIIWSLLGSIAIWYSMPSVFFLSGIFFYYFFEQLKNKKQVLVIIIPAFFWVLSFGIYFFYLLRFQVQSSYLMNYYQGKYLQFFPFSIENYKNNYQLLISIFQSLGGKSVVSISLSILFISSGVYYLLKNNKALFLLLCFPVLFLIIASSLNYYVIVTRIILFIFPVMLILYAFGMKYIEERYEANGQKLLAIAGVLVLILCQKFSLFYKPHQFYEVKQGIEFIVNDNKPFSKIILHHAIKDAYTYYTTWHSDKEKINSIIKEKYDMNWDVDYKIINQVSDSCYFLYCGGLNENEKNKLEKNIDSSVKILNSFYQNRCMVKKLVRKKEF